MAKLCPVCKQSYSDELGACPHCSSAIEIVLGDAPKSGDSAKKPKPPLRVEGSSDSEIEIDLGKLPPRAADDSPSSSSNVKWAALIDKPGESGVDLAAGGLVVDSPSDAALLSRKPNEAARGEKSGSWVDIGVTPPRAEDDGSGIVLAAGGGKPGVSPVGPGSGSDDDIDLAQLEAEARAKADDGSGLVLEGKTPPQQGSGSESEIDLGALTAASEEGDTSARFAERLLHDEGSDVDFSQRQKAPGDVPSGLDLVAEALESGVDLGDTGKKAVTVAGDSGVDLAALFEDEVAATRKGKPRPTDTSAVDLGADLPLSDDPLARSLLTPTSSEVKLSEMDLGRSDVQLAGSSKGPKPGSDVQLAGSSGVGLADSGSGFGESDVQLAGESGRRRGGEVPLAAPVGLVGTSRPKQDSGLALSGEPHMDDDELVPPRATVPAEKAPSSTGAWVGGGIVGALLGTAACVGIWFSGLLSSDQPPPRPAPAAQASVEVAKLKEEVERLKPFEADAQQKGELLTKYEEATEKWKEQVTKLQDKLKEAGGGGTALKTEQAARAKAEADRKLAQDQAAKAEAARKLAQDQVDKVKEQAAVLTKQIDEATTREVTLKKELDEAKKAADPKAMELFKKEREATLVKLKDAESKLADAEKTRKEVETKAADLAKAKKDADAKVAEAEKARLSADQKVADLTAALKEAKGGKPDTAMAKLLEGARTEAADAKKRLDEAVKKLQDTEKVADVARVEAEKAKKDAAQALKAAEAAQDVANAARLKAEKTVALLTQQLAEARATPGGAKTVFPREAVDAIEAEEQYASGVRSYHAGDFTEAERALVEAGRHGGQDARYHYFLGLARLAQGQRETAAADFREAARLERQSKPSRATVNTALERIQGTARQALERYR